MSDIINPIEYWGKVGKIRAMFAPQLSNEEFGVFVGMGKSLGANPFNREIWAVKYGNSPAQIFLGRDFYRRKAQEQTEYKGHQVDAIYSNDSFKMVGGKPEHEYKLMDRGVLVGAYCIVYRKENEPYFNVVKFNEYYSGHKDEKGNIKKKSNGYDMKPNLWDEKPETMIKKVAEAQALRGAFQGVFAGTYDESEEWKQEDKELVGRYEVETIPEEVKHLIGRYPFDKTLKAPKNTPHKPYLGDSTPKELDLVEADIKDGTLDPRYARYFYTISNLVNDFLLEIPNQMLEIDNASIE